MEIRFGGKRFFSGAGAQVHYAQHSESKLAFFDYRRSTPWFVKTKVSPPFVVKPKLEFTDIAYRSIT